ncbi:hypothetical protein CRM89_00380 [Nocardia sp. FDAARGOS_372]|uniref:hypothetical protein n=1 Tax=Nocardia sp. FDAARGOS_372 TaxID=2018066 RepID=UPI000BF09848|nr:hypothetical protein [Nocardia sp. FDAARGOS_372]PEH74640.1 hypothetical protein CRM89_00380 [Nocardia sp. FDAARGOS_372]
MATTKRATTPRTARPARATKPAPAAEAIDILADFGTDEKPPVPIRLGGVEADVRRGFSGDEVVQFHKLLSRGEFEQMLTLITTDGPGLWQFIADLNPDLASKAMNRIINLSELAEGNLLAPLPGYGMTNPAGAQPSPESSTTTG